MEMNLAQKKCVPCEIGTPPLTSEQFEPLLKQLKLEWEVIDPSTLRPFDRTSASSVEPLRAQGSGQGKKIRHEFKFKDFNEAMGFVNKVAKLAENEGHHPNIHIYYSRVVIDLTTHNIKGLSGNDFILAAKIEQIT